ncbi:MAG: DUF3467 domain-containing protein [Hyphomicrobiaceae bacterium]
MNHTDDKPGRNTGDDSARQPSSGPDILWDDSKMVSFYADVVNLQSTREQVYLFFGTNQTWNLGEKPATAPLRVELNSRLILTPHAAKRLMYALNDVLTKYETRFGTITT